MCEWEKVKLGDVVEFQRGHDLPKTRMVNGKYPVIGSSGIIGYHDEFTTKAPSITIGRSGHSVGKPFLYKGISWSHNTTLYIKDFKNNNPYFIFYLLQTLNLSHYSGGSAVPTLNRNHIYTIPILLPPLKEQKRIAAILSSLDDKIEVNNQINKNLEEQAQAIFTSWFVDFEPFGGVMPKDWREGTLGDICILNNKKVSTNTLTEKNYFSTENMLPNKSGVTIANSLPTVEKVTNCSIGSILISNIRPYFKKIHYCTTTSGCSNDVLCFVTKYNELSHYLYFLLYDDNFFEYMMLGSKGTKMPRGDKQQIMQYSCNVPTENILLSFSDIVRNTLSTIDINKKENLALEELRNALLPKLMNGEIHV